MKKFLSSQLSLILFTMTFLFPGMPGFSQRITWESQYAEKTVDGITNICSSIISDAFTPMTHYEKGDYTITGVPALFSVNRPYDDPELKGEDLDGWALALGGGYAHSDRLMSYIICSAISIKGDIISEDLSEYRFDTEYTLFTANAGIGYDLFSDASGWSMPVYLGLSLQHYSISASIPDLPSGAEIGLEGSGFIYAATAGIAVSKYITSSFKITPYILYMRSFNSPEVTAEADQVIIIPVHEERDIDTGNISATMFGLNMGYKTEQGLTYSISVGGLISSQTSWYNDHFLDGLEMKSIVLAVTYTGSAI